MLEKMIREIIKYKTKSYLNPKQIEISKIRNNDKNQKKRFNFKMYELKNINIFNTYV